MSDIKLLGEALGRVLLPHPRDFVLQWSNSTRSAEAIWASHNAQGQSERGLLQWVVVKPGDALFIPCNWWHATLNIGETVAVGGQQLQGKVVERGSCPRDVYAEAAGAMTAVSRGLQQRKAAGGPASMATLSPKEASEGLEALTSACAALRWNIHCDSLRAELLALVKRGDEAVALLVDVAERMRHAHTEGLLSSVQFSAVLGASFACQAVLHSRLSRMSFCLWKIENLACTKITRAHDAELRAICADALADTILGLPLGPYTNSIGSASELLKEAVELVSRTKTIRRLGLLHSNKSDASLTLLVTRDLCLAGACPQYPCACVPRAPCPAAL